MTNADMSPEEGAQRRHRACEEDGDCFIHLRACLSSFMHDRITGKPFLDDEPVLICTKVIAFRLAAAINVAHPLTPHGRHRLPPPLPRGTG